MKALVSQREQYSDGGICALFLSLHLTIGKIPHIVAEGDLASTGLEEMKFTKKVIEQAQPTPAFEFLYHKNFSYFSIAFLLRALV